jgi:hypothetical protein
MSCGLITRVISASAPFSTPSPTPGLVSPAPDAPDGSPTTALTPTSTETPVPTPIPTEMPDPTATASPGPTDSIEDVFYIRTHPDGGLFVGDLVSFEVIPPAGFDAADKELVIQIDAPGEPELGPTAFAPFGIARRMQATMIWAWDTQGLEPGFYNISLSVLPDGPVWEEEVHLRPETELPPPEPLAEWTSVETDCCIIHYVTGTEAERDIGFLMEEADRQAELAIQRMGGVFDEPIVITLLPRVLGHGGFAGREISISYLDRNYAGTNFTVVLHHEMIHILDGRLGGEWRPSVFVEGVAVYLTGGHYKPEPIMPRAAALLEMPGEDPDDPYGWFIPSTELVDDFYATQHEIGYLQAAALVGYMEERWGWEAFDAFYRGIPQPSDTSEHIQTIDAALHSNFGIHLDELERDFIQALSEVPVTAEHIEDVRLTVEYYDTVRRYQRAFDQSAYFRTAWLLWNHEMRERGIVADYLRRAEQPENLAVENLLLGASQRYLQEDYPGTQHYLDAVNALLDVIERKADLIPVP